MKYKNYYKVLELPNARVTDEEIKNAYRRLAKLYHPDLNGGDSSLSEKFKDINEAYEILGHATSRKKYDRAHFAYKFRDSFSANGIKNKINFSAGFGEFVETFMGGNKGPSVVTNFDKYNNQNEKIAGEDLESEIDISLEESFFGGSRKIAYKTMEGKIRTILIEIPKGIRNGEKIRLSGQGKPGKNGGDNGDFYIKVNVIPNEKFTLDGDNLIVDLPITPWESVTGCEIDVERHRF